MTRVAPPIDSHLPPAEPPSPSPPSRNLPAHGQPAEAAGWVVPPDPAQVRHARRWLRTWCAAAGVDDDTAGTVVLLASELITNAVLHGRSPALVRVQRRGSLLQVQVSDDNSRHPQTQPADNAALDGRGLQIVSQLAAAWGVTDALVGKHVWFDVHLPAA